MSFLLTKFFSQITLLVQCKTGIDWDILGYTGSVKLCNVSHDLFRTSMSFCLSLHFFPPFTNSSGKYWNILKMPFKYKTSSLDLVKQEAQI